MKAYGMDSKMSTQNPNVAALFQNFDANATTSSGSGCGSSSTGTGASKKSLPPQLKLLALKEALQSQAFGDDSHTPSNMSLTGS